MVRVKGCYRRVDDHGEIEMTGQTLRRAMIMVVASMMLASLPYRDADAQDAKPLVLVPEAHYYDFWLGDWYRVSDSARASAPSFRVTRSVHPAALHEIWYSRDEPGVASATALRAWDKTNQRWMFTWVSSNGLYQNWEGRKVGDHWYIYNRFDIEGDRYLSRQGFVPVSANRIMRVSEKSYDEGRSWQLRFREYYERRIEPAAADSAAEAAVRRVVDAYMQAQRSGEGRYIREAFHPAARIYFLRADTLGSISAAEFAARFSGAPPSSGSGVRTMRVTNVAITGTLAVATVQMVDSASTVTDALTLMKLGTGWTIVAKATYLSR
jgi:hypothetical protein